MLTVIGMGRKKGDLTLDGKRAIETADVVVVKSAKTHAAKTVAELRDDALFCDDLYEAAEDFDALNAAIENRLASFGNAKVAFCVVGEGSDDSTVQGLFLPFQLVCGVGLHGSLMAGGMEEGTLLFNASAFCQLKDVLPLPTAVKCIDDKFVAAEVQLKLLQAFDADTPLLWCGEQSVKQIVLSDLPKQRFGYMSALYIKPKTLLQKETFGYRDVVAVLRLLRAEDGCPWDKVQTHKTITKNVIEEAYELVNAIDNDDIANMVEELGDLLMQVVFHIGIAEDDGEFCQADVYSALCRKLIDRHPHVFGNVHASNADEALDSWDKVKLKEHKLKNLSENLTDVPRSLSALMRAEKIQSRAAKGGYDFQNMDQCVEKVREELEEFLSAQGENAVMEAGDLLFAVVNLLRLNGIDAETALIKSTEKFTGRVLYVEKLLAERGTTLAQVGAEQFDLLWNEAKKNVG